ncbi:MAG: hypothetical protein IKY33_04495 [Clostridia bacterium]|nr:hypothetical protein [Clostridia bacterium]
MNYKTKYADVAELAVATATAAGGGKRKQVSRCRNTADTEQILLRWMR